MRKIKIYGLLTCVCLMMQSCLFNEDDIFDESSAQQAISLRQRMSGDFKGRSQWVVTRVLYRRRRRIWWLQCFGTI